MGEEYVDIFEPGFIRYFNDKFSEYQLGPPDPSIEPCFAKDGKVKKRGEWDSGPVFAASQSSSFEFMKHQRLIKAFFTNEAPYRGILLYHGLGSGKTLTSQAVSENVKDYRQVIVMTPASLRENFISELKKGGTYAGSVADVMETMESKVKPSGRGNITEADKRIRKEILRKYYFVSYDASNAPDQIRSIPDGLNHKLLIIDEVHNLVSMMNSRSTKGNFMFDTIMNATDLKIIMLSGTPIINDPFELGIIANILAGFTDAKGNRHIRPSVVEDRHKFMLFEDNVNFYYNFLNDEDPEDLKIKNMIKLKRRLRGLISYYAGLQPRSKILPEQVHHSEFVEMSRRQFELYEKVRKLERESEKKLRRKIKDNKSRPFGQSPVNLTMLFSTNERDLVLSNFRSTSRQFCNFTFPEAIPRYVSRLGDVNSQDTDMLSSNESSRPEYLRSVDQGLDAPEETTREDADIQKLNIEASKMLDSDTMSQQYLVKELPIHSAKMHRMMDIIKTSIGPVYVYSQFRSLEGIGIFSKVLKAHGYMEYGWNDANSSKKLSTTPLPHTKDYRTGREWRTLSESERMSDDIDSIFRPLTFLIWPRSTTNATKRNHLLNTFNCESNKHGGIIKVFLSTKAGAEGINLMNVRQVHIMEPYWNEMRITQAIGRAIRQCSHATLPKSQRRVDVYHYVSTINTHSSEDKNLQDVPESSDEYVMSIASRKQKIIQRVEQVMKEVAIDCKLNFTHNKQENPGLVCFDPPPEIDKKLIIDLMSDPTDAVLLGEKYIARTKLISIKLDSTKYRIREQDLKFYQDILKNPKTKFQDREIDLFSPREHVGSVDMRVGGPIVIGRLILIYGKPVTVRSVHDTFSPA